MGLDFAAGPSHLNRNSTPVTEPPFSMSLWVKFNSTPSSNQILMFLGDKDVGDQYHILMMYVSEFLYFRAQTRQGGIFANADKLVSLAGFPWTHVVGVWLNGVNRYIYVDGSLGAHNTTGSNPTGIDRIRMGYHGDSTPSGPADVVMADLALYSINLSLGEIASLSKGYSPLFVRRESLASYVPGIVWNSSTSPDVVGAPFDHTLMSSGAHPPLMYPAPVLGPEYITAVNPGPGGAGSDFISAGGIDIQHLQTLGQMQ